jgi:peroxiredoxin
MLPNPVVVYNRHRPVSDRSPSQKWMSSMRKFAIFRGCLAVALLVLQSALAVSADPADPADVVDVDWQSAPIVRGEPLPESGIRWKVVCFLGTECPLAQLYAPRLQRLHNEFAQRGVQFVGVNSNSQDSPADIQKNVDQLRITFPIVKDARQVWARKFAAKRTPQVFVLDAANRIRYRGRIDDQYEPGISRTEPTRHHLREALEALVADREVPVARTEPVGCLITLVDQPRPAGDPSAAVTFTRDVAPILNQHCVECHRAGEIGPFALTDYGEVVGWADMILEVVKQNRMPPWHADPRYGKFVGARHVPAEARGMLAAWVEQGMPRGSQQDLPPTREWPTGWHLPDPPDLELNMRDHPFTVPAEGTVEYQYFVVDPKWEEDRWVRAAQVVPGDASVVHHAIVFVRPPDGSDTDGIGWLGGYVPGQRTGALPPGHARRIPARSKLVFQMHYTPNGHKAYDATKVGIWFRDADEITHEVATRVALNHHFEIPPGTSDFRVQLRLDGFDRDWRLLGAMPHMHLRGKSFRLEARRGERRETLLRVPDYDFNWQHWYQFESPLALGDIDALEMNVHFDNSDRNPTNPAPGDYVTWGDQTWQEMAIAFLDIARPRGRPAAAPKAHTAGPGERARRRDRIAAEVKRFLADLDKDGDGVVERDETPDAFRRFGFREFDSNGDGRLERDEIEAAAARQL